MRRGLFLSVSLTFAAGAFAIAQLEPRAEQRQPGPQIAPSPSDVQAQPTHLATAPATAPATRPGSVTPAPPLPQSYQVLMSRSIFRRDGKPGGQAGPPAGPT